ncbi:hypothetical protein ACQPZX_06640 [Actinoplanes sp. CA-142083]|uniref:hypothetical protein n=1 Tax=Actinoplanes sp. CA-142083 TaxID=3239903 RepID=UPI003D940285
MTRTGHPRAWRAVRDHRISALAAAFMLLLALGASMLVSAGSPHHERDAHTHAVASAAVDVESGGASAQPAAHEHEHGNEWVPTLGKRVRPAATTTLLGFLPVRPAAQALAVGRTPVLPSHASNDLSALGVLRV